MAWLWQWSLSVYVATSFYSVLNQPFRRNHSTCLSTVLMWPQAIWPPLTASPSLPTSCFWWHKKDVSKEYSLLHGYGICCCSDFLEIGLLGARGLWNRVWNMQFYPQVPLGGELEGSFKSRNWYVPASPLCQQCKCVLPKGSWGRSPSWL